MNLLIVLIIGILIGWFTKVPFLIKQYRELEGYKKGKIELYNRLVNDINGLPMGDRSKYKMSIQYFKDSY